MRLELQPFPGREQDECDVTIELFRVGAGVVDPAFGEGGVFRTTQTRRINFTSIPRPKE